METYHSRERVRQSYRFGFRICRKVSRTNATKNRVRYQEAFVNKKSYSEFLRENIGTELTKKCDEKEYQFLSCGHVPEIEDGLKLFNAVEEKNLNEMTQFLCQPFSIALEGFLIKFFIETGDIDREEYEQDPTSVRIDRLLREKLKNYPQIETVTERIEQQED